MRTPVVTHLVVLSMIAWNAAQPPHALAQMQQPATEAGDSKQPANLKKEQIEKKVEEIKGKIDENETAKKASAGILKPIYDLAESISTPYVHWIAFALMMTGVVSFALQLVIGKLLLLAQLSFRITEILSDALGLAISLMGLVLATQAATENSTFVQSPASVISATAVGVLLGILFFYWGYQQESRAAQKKEK